VKIIHSLGWYFPDSCGGTEVYVSELAGELRTHQIESLIAAPRTGETEDSYLHEGQEVYRYPVGPVPTLRQVRGETPHDGFSFFEAWLRQHRKAVYHQHSWTTGCGSHHLRLAKELGMPTVVTIHTPNPVCKRGTMMLYGQHACDGKIDRVRCTACLYQSHKFPEAVSKILAAVVSAVNLPVGNSNRSSKTATALQLPGLADEHLASLKSMAVYADKIVAVCQWLYDALLKNGVPSEKLVLCRQGIPGEVFSKNASERCVGHEDVPLKIGFLGRWDPVKGIHILVEAIRKIPASVRVECFIYGLQQSPENSSYAKTVLKKAQGDTRIHFEKALTRFEIPAVLGRIDLLAVPSQWLETGPLVVLEAQAAGVPVLGSDLGGIAELVQQGVNGWLVPPTDVQAWADAIIALAKDRKKIIRLKMPVRSMSQAAHEMLKVYQSLP